MQDCAKKCFFTNLALLWCILWGVFCSPPCWGKTLKVGAFFDLSGPSRKIGGAMLSAAKAALQDINPSLSKMGLRVELSVVDTSSEEGRLLLGAMRLKDQEDILCAIGPSNPRLTRVLRSFAEAHSILLFLTAGRKTLIPYPWQKDLGWTFSVSPDIATMVKSLYAHLRHQGVRKIGVLYQARDSWEKDILWLRAYAPEFQMEVVGIEGFDAGDADCITQLNHLKDLGSQVVVFRGDRGFMERLKVSLKATPVSLAFLMDTPFVKSLKHGLPQGVSAHFQVPSFLSKDPSRSLSLQEVRFKNSLRENEVGFESYELAIAASKAWDALHLLAQVILSSGSTTKKAILNTLNGREIQGYKLYVTYKGVTGTFRPSRKNHVGLDPMTLGFILLHGSVDLR